MTGTRRRSGFWWALGALSLLQIGYPLTSGQARAALVVATVVLGYLISVSHALRTHGWPVALILVVVTTGGGLAVEVLGVNSGFPFGDYAYSGALGPQLAGVPVIIPLAWTWMAWPAWLVAGELTTGAAGRVGVAAVALAAWDLFLDPQMVSQGYWRWAHPDPALPGVPGVPVGNYLGWVLVAGVLMALLTLALRVREPQRGAEHLRVAKPLRRVDPLPAALSPGPAPMIALYLWTYYSSVLAHAVFLKLPGSAGWGALGMGLVAIPLTVRLLRAGANRPARPRFRAR